MIETQLAGQFPSGFTAAERINLSELMRNATGRPPQNPPARIHDARVLQARATSEADFLAEHGFVLLTAPTRVTDWGNSEQVAEYYLPEVEAMIRERLYPDRKLIVQQAKESGLDKTPEFINQQRRGTEDLLINMLVSRQANSQQIPSAAEIAKFEAERPGMFANREKWTLDQLNYPLPKDPAVTAKIAAAKSLDEVAQALTSAGIQYTKSTREFDSALLPPAMYAQLGKLQPGEPFVAPGPDRAVASVITAREPAPFTPDQQRQLALSQMKRERVNQLLNQRIKDLKAKAKIEYQPGYAPPKK